MRLKESIPNQLSASRVLYHLYHHSTPQAKLTICNGVKDGDSYLRFVLMIICDRSYCHLKACSALFTIACSLILLACVVTSAFLASLWPHIGSFDVSINILSHSFNGLYELLTRVSTILLGTLTFAPFSARHRNATVIQVWRSRQRFRARAYIPAFSSAPLCRC